MVDRELELTFADLLARPMIERDVTLSCVSNEVGGSLVGNAVWRGARLADLLDEAGVQPGATQLFSTSVDGWTCGSPVSAIMDGRDALARRRHERRAAARSRTASRSASSSPVSTAT